VKIKQVKSVFLFIFYFYSALFIANWQRVVQFRAWAIEWLFNWQAWERGRAPRKRGIQ